MKLMKCIVIFQLFFSMFLLSAADYDRWIKGVVPFLSVPELMRWYERGESFTVIDSRFAKEYSVSRLQNALAWDYAEVRKKDFTGLKQWLSGADRDLPVVVYCSVGVRSEKAALLLVKQGFTRVYNLYGGIFEWANRQYPLYDGRGKTVKVHGFTKKWARFLKINPAQIVLE